VFEDTSVSWYQNWFYCNKSFPSVLQHCWLGNRKGIRPVKSWLLICWWWWFDWSFARLIAPVVTTTSIILCFNKHWLTQIHLENVQLNREREKSWWRWPRCQPELRNVKLQSDYHHQQTSTVFFTGQMLFLLPNQQHQGTEGIDCYTRFVLIYKTKYMNMFLTSRLVYRTVYPPIIHFLNQHGSGST